jgi:hypothetical protein
MLKLFYFKLFERYFLGNYITPDAKFKIKISDSAVIQNLTTPSMFIVIKQVNALTFMTSLLSNFSS